jgi:hypothetical protein
LTTTELIIGIFNNSSGRLFIGHYFVQAVENNGRPNPGSTMAKPGQPAMDAGVSRPCTVFVVG